MNLFYKNKKISGILTIIPENECLFENELENYSFNEAQSLQLKRIMGYNKHRIVDDENMCVSDMCVVGLNYLIKNKHLDKDTIDALILVTQTPDYLIPPTSHIIQGKLNLKQDIYCLDINQGCAGFLIGLMEAFMLLEQESIEKVVLLNADILSRKVSVKDKHSYPLIGDAASVTIIEQDESDSKIFANIQIDGTQHDTMMIPVGGLRLPPSADTSILEEDDHGGSRAKEHLVTKGDILFNFVQTQVPPMVHSLLDFADCPIDDIDYFMFHQPNKFALQKLADKLKVRHEKMPYNIVENFGNPSSVSIPMAITYNCGETLKTHSYLMCCAGFGVGLTWSSMLLNVGNLDFCEFLEC